MGSVDIDARVEPFEGGFRATLSRDWHIWGPCGGYVAAVAMRAVGAYTELARPVSFTCHFLGVGDYKPVDLDVRTLRRTRRAESVGVAMSQDGKPVLEAVAWVVAGDVDGIVHDHATMPDVPLPENLKSFEELASDEVQADSHRFWGNFDERPIEWLDEEEWQSRPAGDPVFRHWVRFRGEAEGDDPFTVAARLLVPLDVCMWPAATRAHAAGSVEYMAPSLDLSAVFHRLDSAREWLLMDGFSPVARDGVVGGEGRVWNEAGELMCTGVQSMLCRPAPPRGA